MFLHLFDVLASMSCFSLPESYTTGTVHIDC